MKTAAIFLLILSALHISCASPEKLPDGKEASAPPSLEEQIAASGEAIRKIRDFITSVAEQDKPALFEVIVRERIKKEPYFKKLMIAIYEENGFKPIFTTEDSISENVNILVQKIAELPLHGISINEMPKSVLPAGSSLPSTNRYPLEKLKSLQADFNSALESSKMVKPWKGVEPQQQTPAQVLYDLFIEREISDEAIYTRLLKHPLFNSDLDSLFVEFRNIKAAVDSAYVAFLKVRADIDVTALVSFFNFALDFKYLIKAHPFKALREPEKADIIFLEKLKEDFHAAEKDFALTMKSFIPRHPLYEGLMKALAFYRRIEELGGFKKVNFAGTLRKGMKSSAVKSLKERLMIEGYYSGEIDNIFDETLAEAVKEYQKTHQFEVNGDVDQKLLKSINVPASQRIKSIELSLQRWRESPVKNDQPLYVRVNIPEFAMELYKDGVLVKKHKVVVGTNAWDKDPEQMIEGRINRTKIFKAEITQIVFNPKWHVPVRIKKLELDYELLAEPDYYEKHKYKVITNPDGTESVFQESGEQNALGVVKFNFPNPFGIFMHDTNEKDKFKHIIRAFSHGCIRLENPMEIAYFILENTDGLTREQVDKLRESGKEISYDLKVKVPIFVEYNAVSIDENGRAMFFADIYNYDRDFFDGKIPYSEEELKLLQRKIPKID